MDPETDLDAKRNVGITGGKIQNISEEALSGKRAIDATGLVVAPGFIDLHQHAWDEESIRLKIRDGVTSVFELEVGTANVDTWYEKYEGKLPFHHGVSVGHIPVRMKVMGDFPSFLPSANSKAATVAAMPEQIAAMRKEVRKGLESGAIAVGFGIYYTPAASHWEILEMFHAAAEGRASCVLLNKKLPTANQKSFATYVIRRLTWLLRHFVKSLMRNLMRSKPRNKIACPSKILKDACTNLFPYGQKLLFMLDATDLKKHGNHVNNVAL